VHLGAQSSTIEEARSVLSVRFGQASRGVIVGYSAHTAEEIHHLAPTYFFYSPVFNPLSKQSERPPLGVDGFQAGVAQTTVPVFALGGITPDNIGGVRRAGAAGGAVITSVLLAPAPDEAAKRFLDAWDEAVK
jgi:thiamine monophosphate synthase